MTTAAPDAAHYPVLVEGHLDRPSRALWLLKWLLLVPHYVVLACLWIAFVVLSLAAFLVVLFTGRYPRGIFDFNVGVLRWTWRVGFYAFAANGTDRYPPFTLDDVADYPARLEVPYPQRQRRGFRLIGWWLLGLPQYVIAGILGGGAGGLGWEAEQWRWSGGVGLISLLVLVAAVLLLFRGAYPRSIFDLALGFDRWVVRVAAYAALMTPEYPPFRIDLGETEPGGVAIAPPEERAAAAPRTWGAGRVTLLVVASIVALAGLVAAAGGVTALVFDRTQRDAAGYIGWGPKHYSTGTFALVSGRYDTGAGGDLVVTRSLLGTVRIRVASASPVFVGIARSGAVDAYLGSVRREVVRKLDSGGSGSERVAGGAPAGPPGAQRFWAARAEGAGTRTLLWKPADGHWRIVLMNRDASAGVAADVSGAARFPHLSEVAAGLLGGGAAVLLAGGLLIWLALRRPRG